MGLSLAGVSSYYGNVQVLRGVDLSVNAGETLCLLGRNGAGKTTLLKTIMGQVRHEGEIRLNGQSIGNLESWRIPRQGIGYVPQGRRLFSELTVLENLRIGLMTMHHDSSLLERVLEGFPILKQRLHQMSGTLSGGEQQMLAMARALCLRPTVLLLDEPTEGLMPSMVAGVREMIQTLRNQGLAILLVEQRVGSVLPVSDRVAFLENGVLKLDVPGSELRQDPGLLHRYVGVQTRC